LPRPQPDQRRVLRGHGRRGAGLHDAFWLSFQFFFSFSSIAGYLQRDNPPKKVLGSSFFSSAQGLRNFFTSFQQHSSIIRSSWKVSYHRFVQKKKLVYLNVRLDFKCAWKLERVQFRFSL
jgi:hypothetical protein